VRLIFLLAAATGCDAPYTDLRPALAAQTDGSTAKLDAGSGSVGDAGPPLDAEAFPSPDAGSMTDGGPVAADAGSAAPAALVGTFEGRSGYDAAGTATLRSAGGALELVLSDDFASAAVPGPVVVVTARPAIGTALTDADTVVARLDGDSISGGNTFDVPLAAAPEPAHVFIYCEPFGVETARAALEPR
jgi:hypothetical protein